MTLTLGPQSSRGQGKKEMGKEWIKTKKRLECWGCKKETLLGLSKMNSHFVVLKCFKFLGKCLKYREKGGGLLSSPSPMNVMIQSKFVT
jgi:hypothetical protein